MRTLWWMLGLLAACGDDSGAGDVVDAPADVGDATRPDAPLDAAPDADTRDIAVRLNELPGVAAVEYTCQWSVNLRCFRMTFEQAVDHTVTGGPTFLQHATLVHVDTARPAVALTSGYEDFYGDYRDELAEVLNGNQISIEHRFFDESRPEPADWTTLTIAQMAADEHHILELLKPIYTGPWLATGASKGGMTASYFRRFYPDDVVATVPYVAPLSRGRGDPRYDAFLGAVGTQACRDRIRAVQVELLTQARFDAMVQRAALEGTSYTRIAIGPAVESAIAAIEFAFWQYRTASDCAEVPEPTASSNVLWSFLNATAAPSDNSDANIAAFEAYYFQAEYELGYPNSIPPHLAGLTRYTGAEYAGVYPLGVTIPAFRPEAMEDIDAWVQSQGERLLFVYGENDPWTAGAYALGAATDSLSLVAPGANHGASLSALDDVDREAAFAKLEAWTGIAPSRAALLRHRVLPRPQPPRLPSALLRARW